jgi:hypothetical protein
MEILLSKNILAFRLLPFPSNVRNSSPQTLALEDIAHVLNFEHIKLKVSIFVIGMNFFSFFHNTIVPCSVRALFPLACVLLVFKSLSQNQMFFPRLFHNENDFIVVHPTPNKEKMLKRLKSI